MNRSLLVACLSVRLHQMLVSITAGNGLQLYYIKAVRARGEGEMEGVYYWIPDVRIQRCVSLPILRPGRGDALEWEEEERFTQS